MKPAMLIGLVLIVLSIGIFAYKGVTYTSHEKIIDMGSMHVSADTKKTIPLSPFVGGLTLVGGIVLVIIGRKRS